MKKQEGISLIELMIGLVLSIMIIATMIQQFINSKRAYHVADVNLMKNYDLQMVIDLLHKSVRETGFTPCAGIGWLTTYDGRNGKKKI